MTARVLAGWLVVPYTGHDLARVYIATGQRAETWTPAFLDWVDGERVAKIRPPAGLPHGARAWLKTNNVVTEIGRVVA